MHLRRELASGLVLLMCCILLLGFPGVVLLVTGESQGWQVDVYTQKEPYNGVGLGEPSDAFAPEEIVLLYAKVTYNSAPVKNIFVAFSVEGPCNPVQNVTLSLTAATNNEGVADTSFSIPWPLEDPEAIVFGTWTVVAYSKNDTSDSLAFRVGWIIEPSFLSVVDEDPPQGGWLGVQLSLTSIAMTPRNVTLVFVFFDSSDDIMGCLVVEDFVNAGGGNFSTPFQIPHWAAVGVGTVHASVYAPSGPPYSPVTLSANFLISFLGDLNGDDKVDMTDLGIASLAFGSFPGHPRWNPVADVIKDNKVDMMDIGVLSSRFGTGYP